ncbi:alpha/beta hydrolase [Dactylosporangium sp. CA-233914]|uniref:alpha/beta hydrolase n=1 Tax=Dactylosporangium sp. CA-233914 TaxID=3239934 RepID=UPI003D8B91FF
MCALTQDPETSMSAAVLLNGYLGPYEGKPDVPSSPWDYVRPYAPPMLIVHGSIDPLVPAGRNRAFAERLREVSNSPVHYLELPGGQHAFDLYHSPRFEAAIDAVEAFATHTVKP